ncbi:potassium channel family protein [Pseudomonas japonica]|uniref:potassium channel family protein n=1 Tax=Pseudomonas japonica TaxID=256466 RepID=UPI0015E34504|nr:potassium channel family protein [Pseudomonas japonica]MBA1245451.1 two pore domain potassium channel family protein [Pseudomonas japonica]
MLGITVLNTAVVTLAVLIHYECLLRLNAWMPRLILWHRFRIAFGVLGALVAHALEIWCFALAYFNLIRTGGHGSLVGAFDGTVLDCAYFSFVTFTTIGFGDIEPIGALKFLAGLEGLTGLVLISWTASFLFLEMQRYWKDR